jgi:hypothetical protein
MARNTSGGPWYGLASGTSHSNKIAAVGAGAYLTEIRCQGIVVLPYSAVSFTTGNWPTYNLVAGIQYGATGYTATTITTGAPGSANWIQWAGGLVPADEINDNTGASPLGVMERVSYALDVNWRGLWYCPSGTDVYLEIGMDTSQPVHTAFIPFYNHWAVWAS